MSSSPSRRPSSSPTDPRLPGSGRPWRPIKGGRISGEVVRQIRSAFFEGLPPGTWLGTEMELASRFAVSRVTMRDALRTLESRGIVEVKVGAGGGVRVAAPDPERFNEAMAVQMRLIGVGFPELIEAQGAIEPATARLAAASRTDAQLAALSESIARQEKTVDDPIRFTDHAARFHLIVADAAGNRVLAATLMALNSVQRETYTPRTTADRARRVVGVHRQIFEAIAEARSADAAALMDEHVRTVRSSHGGNLPL